MTKEAFDSLPTGTIVSAVLTEDGSKTLFIKINHGRSKKTCHWHFLTDNTFSIFEGNSIFENPYFAESVKIEIALMTIIQWRQNDLTK